MWVWSLGWEDPLKKEMATHSGIFAWKIPWTEEPGGLSSMGSERVKHWAHVHTGSKAASQIRSQELPLQQPHPPRIVTLRGWEMPTTSSYSVSWHWQNQGALPVGELSSAPWKCSVFLLFHSTDTQGQLCRWWAHNLRTCWGQLYEQWPSVDFGEGLISKFSRKAETTLFLPL